MPSVSVIVEKIGKSEIKCVEVVNHQQNMASGTPVFKGKQQALCLSTEGMSLENPLF